MPSRKQRRTKSQNKKYNRRRTDTPVVRLVDSEFTPPPGATVVPEVPEAVVPSIADPLMPPVDSTLASRSCIII